MLRKALVLGIVALGSSLVNAQATIGQGQVLLMRVEALQTQLQEGYRSCVANYGTALCDLYSLGVLSIIKEEIPVRKSNAEIRFRDWCTNRYAWARLVQLQTVRNSGTTST